MSITITQPTDNSTLDLIEPVEFKGTASSNIIRLSFVSPFNTNSFTLGRTNVLDDSQWIFSYLFNTGGQRQIEVIGFDADGDVVDSVEVTFNLKRDSPSFDFPPPNTDRQVYSLTLYATFYNVHLASNTSSGNPLLDLSGNALGPKLSDRDWCQAALEGTVQVTNGDVRNTYNYAGVSPTVQVNCRPFFPNLSSSVFNGTNRVRFKLSNGPFGEGTAGFILVPYRTIAVDRNFIGLGSVIYIPDVRGKRIQLPSGETAVHDGYFFAADVGGAINRNHIDVFLGTSSSRGEFTFITSTPSSTFIAYLISNPQISRSLTSMHTL